MLIEATEQDKEEILSYLYNYYEECLYLYLDVSNYNIESENCRVWMLRENHEIMAILMRYYDSYQVFSHIGGYDLGELADIIVNYPHKMVSGRRDLIEVLSGRMPDYKSTYGVVFEMNRPVKGLNDATVEIAGYEDVREIAEFIRTDSEIGAHYTLDALIDQLRSRMSTNTGRSCIIRDNGEIIAHTATYAEGDKIAVVSGTVIRQDYRNTNCFLKVTTELQSILASEGKRVYVFATSDKMVRYHSRLHRVCGEYGKLERI